LQFWRQRDFLFQEVINGGEEVSLAGNICKIFKRKEKNGAVNFSS
jgi:hypothetical protein